MQSDVRAGHRFGGLLVGPQSVLNGCWWNRSCKWESDPTAHFPWPNASSSLHQGGKSIKWDQGVGSQAELFRLLLKKSRPAQTFSTLFDRRESEYLRGDRRNVDSYVSRARPQQEDQRLRLLGLFESFPNCLLGVHDSHLLGWVENWVFERAVGLGPGVLSVLSHAGRAKSCSHLHLVESQGSYFWAN